MAQHTVTLQCIKDNYAKRDWSDIGTRAPGNGNESILRCGWTSYASSPEHSPAVYNDVWPSMQFEQKYIPPNKKLVAAFVFAKIAPGNRRGSTRIVLYDIEGQWAETDKIIPSGGLEFPPPTEVNGWLRWGYDDYTSSSTNSIVVKDLNGYGVQMRPWDLSITPGVEIENDTYVYARESGYPAYAVITYEDSPPLKPIASEPKDIYISPNRVITASWTYRAAYGGEQKAYKVEWRQQGASSWEEITETTANNYCAIPADTLPAGNIEWRVTTYNEYDEASPVSDTLKFYAIGQPAAPSVYVEPSATPLITWDAAEQQLWQAQVLNGDTVIYDTGEQPATVWQHRVPDYLEDGDYTARVRVRNAYGFWSPWGEGAFAVLTVKPAAPTIAASANNDYGITITVDCAAPKCLLYRREIGGDYVLIGEVEDKHTDYNVASGVRYEYMARAVNEDNSFSDSAPKTSSVTLPGSVISLGDVILPLRNRLDAGWGRDYNRTHLRVLSQFVGRAYPVVESEGFKTQTLSLNYFLTPAELDIMQVLIEAPVILYRNDMGDMFSGTIGNIGYNERLKGTYRGYDVTFDIQRVGDGRCN